MEAVLISAAVVALAEIGDKTQLLAVVLAVRFRKPLPVIGGILVATIVNHGLSALGGYYIADLLAGPWFQIAIGVSFLAMAAWTLIPDRLDNDDAPIGDRGAFVTSLIAFFLVEIGDKTQIATAALAARFHAIIPVAIGTTMGMLLADVPVVFLGHRAANWINLKLMHALAAVIFAMLGVWVLWGVLAP